MSLDELASTENTKRKRKADALGRLCDSSTKKGRGSLVGWTTCPLCGDVSKKKFALGRGISTHLLSVHAPWNPGKAEVKRQRRLHERQIAEKRRQGTAIENDKPFQIKRWEPSQVERDDWDAKVLEIVRKLEDEQNTDNDNTPHDDGKRQKVIGVDRCGHKSQTYRESLPAFIQAAADGNMEELRAMVEQAQATGPDGVKDLIDKRDRHLSIAEHWAAGGGHLECLTYLVGLRKEYDAKASSNETLGRVRRRDGKTALHYAARYGRLSCIRFLLDQGQHFVDEKSGDGTTPLHLAVFGCHPQAVELLIKRGACPTHANDWGCTAAHWLAMTKYQSKDDVLSLCAALKDHGLSFTASQSQGHTPLHKAAQHLNRHFIEWLSHSEDEGGAGLTSDEKRLVGLPDKGGNVPSLIWKNVGGGDESFVEWMEQKMGW